MALGYGNPYAGSLPRRQRTPYDPQPPHSLSGVAGSLLQNYQPHGMPRAQPPAGLGTMPGMGVHPAPGATNPYAQVPQSGAVTAPRPPLQQIPSAPATAQAPQMAGATNPYEAQAPAMQAPGGHVGFKGSGEGALTRYLREDYGTSGDMLNQLHNLGAQANTDPYNELASENAGQFARINDYYGQAQGHLRQALADRGMSDSTAFGTGVGALYGQQAQAEGQLSGDLLQQARQRQDMLQQRYDQMLEYLRSQGVDIASGKAQRRLQKWLKEQEQQFNWGDALGAYGQFAGQTAGQLATAGAA